MEGWIDLVEYSKKYGVSTSTLRRRIRSNSIQYKLNKGRYWLEDSPEVLTQAPLFSRQAVSQTTRQSAPNAPSSDVAQEEISRLQAEGRKLREQIAELQTLVQVLEDQLAAQD